MKKLFSDLLNSLNTQPSGWSARKICAFIGVLGVSVPITFKHSTDQNVSELVMIWLIFALLCLGLVTFSQLVDWRTGTKKEIKVTETTVEK